MFEIVFLLFILFNRVEYIFGAVPMIPPNYHDMALHSTVGLMIDAGSGGSRLHIYKWDPRVFSSPYPSVSFPSTDENWTDVILPGISAFKDNPFEVRSHIKLMIDYAKDLLQDVEDQWQYFPIYLKATGGMRELSMDERIAIMTVIREYLSDSELCPFLFEPEFARVISGEEEAAFAWAAANFLMGILVDPLEDNLAVHDSVSSAAKTYGTLDLGGASTQIAFYVPNQEIMEGLFKLQIGRKHWNIYTKSFLQFGHNSARIRHLHDVSNAAYAKLGNSTDDSSHFIYTPCFHSGYTEEYFNKDVQSLMNIHGPQVPSSQQFQQCKDDLVPLLQLPLDPFCEWVYHGECGIAGQYQPSIPPEEKMPFIGLSSYEIPWDIFDMPTTTTLFDFSAKVEYMCSLPFSDLVLYIDTLDHIREDYTPMIPYFCFMGTYIVTLLTEGYGFPITHALTVLKKVDGHKVGWTLGAILYEINSLPWLYKPESIPKAENVITGLLAGNIGFILGALCMWLFLRQLADSDKEEEETVIEDTDMAIENSNDSIGSPGSQWGDQIMQYLPFVKTNGWNQQQQYEEVA